MPCIAVGSWLYSSVRNSAQYNCFNKAVPLPESTRRHQMMQSLWSSEMSTGLKAIDDLHHDFLDSLARLPAAKEEEFENAYAIFVMKVEHAFSNEEIWMEEIDFPGLKSHREQHARVLGALHKVHSKIMQGDLNEGRHVVRDLLPQWFALHLSTMDMTLGMSVQAAKGRSSISSGVHALEYVD